MKSSHGPRNPISGVRPRLLEANRSQMRLIPTDLDRLVAEDHQVRAVWAFVEGLDLSAFYSRIRAVEGQAGRAPIDPKILLALWIEATLDGIGSARELNRLSQEHVVYQWICGGVAVNYHTLSDFRSASAELLDPLLTDSVAVLLNQGLVELTRVAHDGMRVRASAGANSFRTGHRLRKLRRIAREQVERLSEELERDSGASSRRRQAARQREAQSRAKRVGRALEQLPEIEQRKRSRNGKKKSAARASTTDPDARVMKMADGGFRPAFNVHLAADTASQAIVAVAVTNQGTDSNMMVPLAEQIEQRHQRRPNGWLADGGCVSVQNVEAMHAKGCKLYAPLRAPRRNGRKSTDIRYGDSVAVAQWRKRMETPSAHAIYKQRAAVSECVNAQMRNRGLTQFLVRGLEKIRAVILLHALTHNMTRTWALAR